MVKEIWRIPIGQRGIERSREKFLLVNERMRFFIGQSKNKNLFGQKERMGVMISQREMKNFYWSIKR